jgi:uncharacterized LabA/DUF88 family protein
MLKDSFLRTISSIILTNLPVVAESKAGSFKKIFIFIDGSNFYHSLEKSFGTAKIDLQKFSELFSKYGTVKKVTYYTATLNISEDPKKYSKQQRFLSKIRQINKVEVFLGRLEKRNNIKVEKGVDVKIAVDIVTNAFHNNYDIAILVSNDADFVPAIKEAQNFGKQVWNINFPKTQSFHLNKTCDKTINLYSIENFLVKK